MFASKDVFLTPPSGGYTINRSVRLRSSASAYFNRTPASTTNRTTFTISFWMKLGTLGSAYMVGAGNSATASGTGWGLRFSSNTLQVSAGGGLTLTYSSVAVFRDPSAWYHVVLSVDTTQATNTNRVKVYVNNSLLSWSGTPTYPSQNQVLDWNYASATSYLGSYNDAGTIVTNFDGLITEVNSIDGQALTPSSFGTTNAITGVWQPAKYTGTYGTNGFYLNFSDNSGATATTIGKDYSGNGNNWTPNNISVTAGSTYDSMVDSPTVSAVSSNYCVLNPLATGVTVVNGNLDFTYTAANRSVLCTMGINTGKWRWEFTPNGPNNNYDLYAGIIKASATFTPTSNEVRFNANAWGVGSLYGGSTQVRPVNNNTFGTSLGWTWTNGDVLGLYFDATNGTLKANQNGGSLVTVYTGLTTGIDWLPIFSDGSVASATHVTNYGQRPFAYATVDSTYNALNTYNLPASTITNGAAYMAASTYTGTLLSNSIVNSGNNAGAISFKPDLVWIKSRSAATDHKLTDSVRGVTKALISDTTGAETTDAQGLTAFNSNGFTVGTDTNYNNLSATYVAWQWQAGGSSSSNTNGSITSTVSVGATQGFSVVTYTGTGANATVGHGLGVAPSLIVVFNRSGSDHDVYHASLGNNSRLFLNTTAAASSPAGWNATSPTSSVFSLGSGYGDVNANGTNYVAYCFAAVKGFSAFGSYTGNGSADGPFVYTGFRPRYIMIKCTTAANSWVLEDTSRDTYNPAGLDLFAESSGAEVNNIPRLDILSNGFKLRNTYGGSNASSATYIYACFAEVPFRSALAR